MGRRETLAYRQWCKTDPLVDAAGGTYAVILGVSGDAKGAIRSVGVEIGFADADGQVRGHHRLAGVPIDFAFSPHATGVALTIQGADGLPCSIEVREDGPAGATVLAGAGLTGQRVEAAPVETG